jgi:hypothetical protein
MERYFRLLVLGLTRQAFRSTCVFVAEPQRYGKGATFFQKEALVFCSFFEKKNQKTSAK